MIIKSYNPANNELLGQIETTNVTDMSTMFFSCTALISLNLSNFNTSQVTDMSNMFRDCSKLISLNLSSFDTSQVTNMSYMFHNCSTLTSLDFNQATFEKVTSFDYMFGIKANIYMVVKDDTARNWLQNRLNESGSFGTIVTVDEITSS